MSNFIKKNFSKIDRGTLERGRDRRRGPFRVARFARAADQRRHRLCAGFKADGRASVIGTWYGPKALDKMAITLPPAAALSGRVTDTKGKPVAGAHGLDGRPPANKPLDGFHSPEPTPTAVMS